MAIEISTLPEKLEKDEQYKCFIAFNDQSEIKKQIINILNNTNISEIKKELEDGENNLFVIDKQTSKYIFSCYSKNIDRENIKKIIKNSINEILSINSSNSILIKSGQIYIIKFNKKESKYKRINNNKSENKQRFNGINNIGDIETIINKFDSLKNIDEIINNSINNILYKKNNNDLSQIFNGGYKQFLLNEFINTISNITKKELQFYNEPSLDENIIKAISGFILRKVFFKTKKILFENFYKKLENISLDTKQIKTEIINIFLKDYLNIESNKSDRNTIFLKTIQNIKQIQINIIGKEINHIIRQNYGFTINKESIDILSNIFYKNEFNIFFKDYLINHIFNNIGTNTLINENIKYIIDNFKIQNIEILEKEFGTQITNIKIIINVINSFKTQSQLLSNKIKLFNNNNNKGLGKQNTIKNREKIKNQKLLDSINIEIKQKEDYITKLKNELSRMKNIFKKLKQEINIETKGGIFNDILAKTKSFKKQIIEGKNKKLEILNQEIINIQNEINQLKIEIKIKKNKKNDIELKIDKLNSSIKTNNSISQKEQTDILNQKNKIEAKLKNIKSILLKIIQI